MMQSRIVKNQLHINMSTEDPGETWTNVTGDLPNFAIDDMFADPNIPGRVLVATLGSSGFALEDR